MQNNQSLTQLRFITMDSSRRFYLVSAAKVSVTISGACLVTVVWRANRTNQRWKERIRYLRVTRILDMVCLNWGSPIASTRGGEALLGQKCKKLWPHWRIEQQNFRTENWEYHLNRNRIHRFCERAQRLV